jgi:glycosyltransferase involved in cell wall biosynthesis
MPSRVEGLGLVAAESQLCGTPVIAYDSGGLPDVVSPDAGGTLVPVGDIAGLAAAIDRLVGTPAHAQALGEAARAHVIQVFSPQHVARSYLTLYESLNPTLGA